MSTFLKRLFIVLTFTFLIAFNHTSQTFALSSDTISKLDNTIIFFEGSSVSFINGIQTNINEYNQNVYPYVDKKIVFTPLNFTCDKLGATSKISLSDGTITLTTKDKATTLTLLSPYGEDYSQFKNFCIIDRYHEELYISVKDVSEALGKSYFHDKSGLIIISDVNNSLDISKDTTAINELITTYSNLQKVSLYEAFYSNNFANNYGPSVIYKDKIYFINQKKSNNLYVMDFKGNSKLIINDNVQRIYDIKNDYIYFYSKNYSNYRCKIDGINMKKLSVFSTPYIFNDIDYIYGLEEDLTTGSGMTKLVKININSGKKLELVQYYTGNNDRIEHMSKFGDYLYYEYKNSVYRVYANGGKPAQLIGNFKSIGSEFLFNKNYIYIQDNATTYMINLNDLSQKKSFNLGQTAGVTGIAISDNYMARSGHYDFANRLDLINTQNSKVEKIFELTETSGRHISDVLIKNNILYYFIYDYSSGPNSKTEIIAFDIKNKKIISKSLVDCYRIKDNIIYIYKNNVIKKL